jgi:hypothetical protein
MISDGINVIWGHRNESAGIRYALHHPNGLVPVATAYTVATDISPVISGNRYGPYWAADGSWHIYKSLFNANPYIYMMGYCDGTSQSAWFLKTSFLGTAADWHFVYDFGNYKLLGVDVSAANTQHIVGDHNYGVILGGAVWYSTDGGYTWTDKTGNLGALGWNNQHVTALKFAVGSALTT